MLASFPSREKKCQCSFPLISLHHTRQPQIVNNLSSTTQTPRSRARSYPTPPRQVTSSKAHSTSPFLKHIGRTKLTFNPHQVIQCLPSTQSPKTWPLPPSPLLLLKEPTLFRVASLSTLQRTKPSLLQRPKVVAFTSGISHTRPLRGISSLSSLVTLCMFLDTHIEGNQLTNST